MSKRGGEKSQIDGLAEEPQNVPCVIHNLWEMPDSSSSEIMVGLWFCTYADTQPYAALGRWNQVHTLCPKCSWLSIQKPSHNFSDFESP